MDLEQNPFAFLSEEEDTNVLIHNAKASAAAVAAKETAVEEVQRKNKNERKNERTSTKAKRIILPRYVTKRDIIVRKEKQDGEGDVNGGSNFNVQQNSVAGAHRSNGHNKGTINKQKSYNGHVNDFKGNNKNGIDGHTSRNKNNVNSSDGQSPESNKGKYRSYDGFANNGGRGRNQSFNGTSRNASNHHLELKVEKVSNGVEEKEEDNCWTKVEKRRTRGRRSGSYDCSSSQVSAVSEKETISDDVQEVVSNVENNYTVWKDVKEVNDSAEKAPGNVEEGINAENNNTVAEPINDENKSNETDSQQIAAGEKERIERNGSQKRKNKNKNTEVIEKDSQKKEKPVANYSLKMTLQEYEKSLFEKRKALDSLKKTESSRVIQLKDFSSMAHLEKKTDDGLSTNQNTKNSHNHKNDGRKEEEKSQKVENMVALRKKCSITLHLPPRRPYIELKEPAKGNGNVVASETEKQQQTKGTVDDKLSGSETGRKYKYVPPPILENLEQFPMLGGKVA